MLATKRIFLFAAPVLATLNLTGCGESQAVAAAKQMTGGDPARGKTAINRYGCSSCHTISGIPGAVGKVGPPLNGIAGRAYIAGVLPNSPGALVRWIQNPKAIDEKTAMPSMGISGQDARDIAAYLYTLR